MNAMKPIGAPWEKVLVKPISNDSARVIALLAGDVDMIDFIPTADFPEIKEAPHVTLAQSISNRLIYLHLDSNRDISPFVTDKDGLLMMKNPLKDVAGAPGPFQGH